MADVVEVEVTKMADVVEMDPFLETVYANGEAPETPEAVEIWAAELLVANLICSADEKLLRQELSVEKILSDDGNKYAYVAKTHLFASDSFSFVVLLVTMTQCKET